MDFLQACKGMLRKKKFSERKSEGAFRELRADFCQIKSKERRNTLCISSEFGAELAKSCRRAQKIVSDCAPTKEVKLIRAQGECLGIRSR